MVASNAEMEELYRKRLMVVATGILIFVIAGGSLSKADPNANATEIVMFGVKLIFSRPNWLEWAALAVMGYLWLRHQQFSFEENEKLKAQVYENTRISRRISVKALGAESTYYHGPGDYEGKFRSVRYYRTAWKELFDEHEPYNYPISICVSSFYKIIVCVTLIDRDSDRAVGWKMERVKGVVEHLQFYFSYAVSYLQCAYKYPEFCHAKLPSWLACISAISYLVSQLFI
ncbi:hypothetical protein ACK3YV_03635 [Aeromonas caviae]